MNPHIHEVHEKKHQVFLNEGRRDPFTKEKIKAGDRIVFCAKCKSAFLHSSWEAMRGKHCKQTETLIEFPHPPRFYYTAKLRPPTSSVPKTPAPGTSSSSSSKTQSSSSSSSSDSSTESPRDLLLGCLFLIVCFGLLVFFVWWVLSAFFSWVSSFF